MSRQVNINETLTFNPTGYADVSNITTSTNASYAISNGYTTYNSTTRARLLLSTSTTGSMYYTFGISGIPENATIDSVEAIARICVNNASRVTNTGIQIYSGTTAKGSSQAFSTTSTTNDVTISGGSSWTVSEVNNIRLFITGTGSSSSQNKYIYFYGADLNITYHLQGTMYTITATSTLNSITATPATQELLSGETATIRIDGISNLNDITVTDNDIDITNQLVEQTISGGSIEKYPGTQTTSGISSGSSYAAYAVGHSAENPYSSTSNMYASSGSTGYAEYPFDFSDIPSNATINSVTVRAYGHRESSSTGSNYVAKIGLYSGSTLKSTEQEFTSTSNGIITITNPGTWTLADLQSAKLRFTVGYYGGLLLGATWIVEYSVETSSYYTYTLTNIDDDHVILIEEAGAFIPPEEDPEYTYYPITISSINATTDPTKGTTRVVEGTNQTVTIYPDDPLVTLILDNGTDVSSQLVQHAGTAPSYTVSTAPNASYGFNLNSSTGYYVSTNGGLSSTASVARVNLNLPVRCLVTFTFINNGEETYDFGVFGKVDTTLSTAGWTASSDGGDTTTDAGLEQLRCNIAAYNTTTPQTLTYEIAAGEHYIDVKYGKDQGTDSGNDSLQFKLTIEALEPINYYTYTLTNIQQKHSLIFVFGDVQFYYITSSGTDCKLYPDGQFVELDGDNYRLTIVPNNPNATVSLTDNTVNVTSSLERKTSTVEKDGQTITYVSYDYLLQNINAAHTLIASCVSNGFAYYKVNGTWVTLSKVYKKIDDRWQEQTDFSNLFDTTKIYINAN